MGPGQNRVRLLTKRERDILRLIGEGHSSKEIAWQLGLSKQTVSSHRKHICQKLGVHSTAELIVYAIRVFSSF